MSNAVLKYAMNKRASLIDELKQLVGSPYVDPDLVMVGGMEKAQRLTQ